MSQAIVKNTDSGVVAFTLGVYAQGGGLCRLAYVWQGAWRKLNDMQSSVCPFEPTHSAAVPSPSAQDLSPRKTD